MRKALTFTALLALVALMLPTLAAAMDPPVFNGEHAVLGIFTASDAENGDNNVVVTPNSPLTIYFVIYHGNNFLQNVGGFEFAWRMDPEPAVAPFILQVDLPPGAVPIGTNFNFVVGLGVGYPFGNGDHLTLVTMQMLFPGDPGTTYAYLAPAENTSIPDVMVYNDFNDPGLLLPMYPNSVDGDFANPVFGFNDEDGVATVPSTLSEIKALYR